MKIFGEGVLTATGSSRVVWDFVDGIFETMNTALIAEAKKRGCWLGEDAENAFSLEAQTRPASDSQIDSKRKTRRAKA